MTQNYRDFCSIKRENAKKGPSVVTGTKSSTGVMYSSLATATVACGYLGSYPATR